MRAKSTTWTFRLLVVWERIKQQPTEMKSRNFLKRLHEFQSQVKCQTVIKWFFFAYALSEITRPQKSLSRLLSFDGSAREKHTFSINIAMVDSNQWQFAKYFPHSTRGQRHAEPFDDSSAHWAREIVYSLDICISQF